MNAPSWDRRVARAEKLAENHPTARELLLFYADMARFQKSVYEALSLVEVSKLDTTLLIPHFNPLLSLVKKIGPNPLVEAAAELAAKPGALQDLLISWRDSELDSGAEPYVFFRRALLQPYMESAASRSAAPAAHSLSTCPFCGEKPIVGVLREEGDGGKRSLICSLCATEWEFRRIVCPGCGEETIDKLAVYTAEEFAYIRLEACDTCKTYLKTVDLTRNGLAVPVVDEIASVPLNLWAEEHGYSKIQLNLLNM